MPGATAGAFAAVSRHPARASAHLVSDVEVIPNGIDLTTWRKGAGGGDAVWGVSIVPGKAPHLATIYRGTSGCLRVPASGASCGQFGA